MKIKKNVTYILELTPDEMDVVIYALRNTDSNSINIVGHKIQELLPKVLRTILRFMPECPN